MVPQPKSRHPLPKHRLRSEFLAHAVTLPAQQHRIRDVAGQPRDANILYVVGCALNVSIRDGCKHCSHSFGFDVSTWRYRTRKASAQKPKQLGSRASRWLNISRWLAGQGGFEAGSGPSENKCLGSFLGCGHRFVPRRSFLFR